MKLTIAVLLLLTAICSCQRNKSEGLNPQLGIIAPLSGPAVSMGSAIEKVAKLTKLETLSLKFEDDQCDPKKAIAAYNKLKTQGVKFYYVACSGSLLSLAPLVKRDGNLIITAYAGSSKIRSTGKEVIRFVPDANTIGEVMLEGLLKSKYQRFGILAEDQEYADSAADIIEEGLGEKIAVRTDYKPIERDFRSILLQMQRKKIDALIIIPVSDAAARVLYRQMQGINFKPFIYGEVNLCGYRVKPSEFGLSGVCWQSGIESAGQVAFLAEYKKQYDSLPEYPFYDGLTFDSINVLEKVINDLNQAGHEVTVSDVQNEILKGQSGSVTSYRFSIDGEVWGASYLRERAFSPEAPAL